MGLLDDAIREHLELKRAHGADPSEVARQEAEVLGASRTPTAPKDDAAAEPADSAEPAAPARPEPEDRAEPLAPPEPVERGEPAPAEPDPEPLPEPRDAGPPTERFTPETDLDWSDPPSGGRDDDPEVVPADEEEGEDVLEETPEFLQETPEHDRLWFEQRPPRDFDF